MNVAINSDILDILEEFKIKKDDGICYLMSLFYGYKPSYIPQDIIYKIQASGIIVESKTGIDWKIPLFEGQETVWEWVNSEYIKMFTDAGNGGHAKDSIIRMKKLFAKNPEIRKDDVIGATQLYLYNTDNKFIRKPHYFIEKGVGAEKTQDILDWIDKYKIANAQSGDGTYNTLE